MRRTVRAVVVGGSAVAALAAGVPAASADTTPPPPPSYNQITLSPEESQQLCATLLPKLIDRRNKLAARINGDANTQGSVAWLRARADKQRAAGHPKVADQLVVRADRRAKRAADLKSVEDRLTNFKNTHCVAK